MSPEERAARLLKWLEVKPLADMATGIALCIKGAVAERTEECAKMVESQKIAGYPTTDPWNVSLDLAAALIRRLP